MAVDESHHMDRRGFLATVSKTALMGTGLLAAGWPEGAGATPAATPGAATPRAAAPRALAAGEEKTGQIEANGLRFSYVELGAGPLALCLHGWPDSPYTYRYLMPALAEAGYRAVVPYMRG
ncbi:MAG: alpha/beta fold hydrolase, partial [Acidimicrobiia bacterium]